MSYTEYQLNTFKNPAANFDNDFAAMNKLIDEYIPANEGTMDQVFGNTSSLTMTFFVKGWKGMDIGQKPFTENLEEAELDKQGARVLLLFGYILAAQVRDGANAMENIM